MVSTTGLRVPDSHVLWVQVTRCLAQEWITSAKQKSSISANLPKPSHSTNSSKPSTTFTFAKLSKIRSASKAVSRWKPWRSLCTPIWTRSMDLSPLLSSGPWELSAGLRNTVPRSLRLQFLAKSWEIKFVKVSIKNSKNSKISLLHKSKSSRLMCPHLLRTECLSFKLRKSCWTADTIGRQSTWSCPNCVINFQKH